MTRLLLCLVLTMQFSSPLAQAARATIVQRHRANVIHHNKVSRALHSIGRGIKKIVKH